MSIHLQAAINTYSPLILDAAELAAWQGGAWHPPMGTTASASAAMLHDCVFVTDSRQLPAPGTSPHCIFIPLLGPNFNGHTFIEDALSKGATGYLYDPRYHCPAPSAPTKEVLRLAVMDTRKAYMALAAAHRHHTLTRTRLIAISGSCGKTTLRSYLHQLLAPYGAVISTLNNHNNDLGVSQTLLRAQAATSFVVCEMGMRHRSDLTGLVKIARPDVCVLTGVEPTHLSCVGGSLDEVYAGKLELFRAAPEAVWIAPSANPRLMAELLAEQHQAGRGCFSEAHEPVVDPQLSIYTVRVVASRPDYTSLTTTTQLLPSGGKVAADAPAPDTPITLTVDTIHSAAPRLLAAALCAAGQVLPEQSLSTLNHRKVQTRTSSRFAVIHHSHRGLIIDDTYNASPASMQAGLASVLQWLDHQPQPFAGTCTVILGDMLELGHAAKKFHHDLGQWLQRQWHKRSCTGGAAQLHLLLCGPLSQQIAADWPNTAAAGPVIYHYATAAQLLTGAPWQSLLEAWRSPPQPPAVVYLKASHGIGFFKLVADLNAAVADDSSTPAHSCSTQESMS